MTKKLAKTPCPHCGESYLIEKRNQTLHQAEWCLEQAHIARYQRKNAKRKPKKETAPLRSEIRIINDPLRYAGWLSRGESKLLRLRCPEDLHQQLALSLLEMGVSVTSATVTVDVYKLARQVKTSVYRMVSDYGFSSPKTSKQNRINECALSEMTLAKLHNWATTWKCA